MQSRSGFSGVYPVAYALFDEAGDLSREAMRRQIEAMVVHKVHGVAVLGLASEVNKLAARERSRLLEWVAEDLNGRAPLAVTVAEPSVASQVEAVRAAAQHGARWVILQPPPVKGVPESELIRFFGAVADKSPIPVAIQNAPQYLGVGLSISGLRLLNRAHPNVSIVKLEATAIAVRKLIEETEGAFDVFNGRGGIEITDSMRAGAVGNVPGGETYDVLVRIFNEMATGTAAGDQEAERLYCEVLPLFEFLMESMDTFLVYGKQVLGHRLGITETSSRPPFTPATPFGSEIAKRHADRLGPLLAASGTAQVVSA
jgi:4-hydroxy-tetrahydrodipicolinate synthase